ncbi:MAG: HAMP domain-containing histidine kinase [Bacteroidetes bacterium]|nr:HAMP domain-containing histidine kinase [Bacteroidota bacterium]
MSIRDIIVGRLKDKSEEEQDKFLLAGYFLFMYIAVDAFFLITNVYNDDPENAPILAGLSVSVACLILLRNGWRNLAITLQLIRTNFIAFYFTMIDEAGTGNYMYFVVSSIGALALFGYEERWKGVLFSLLSVILFYTSIFIPQEFYPSSAHFFMVMNFTIAFAMSFVVIYFLNQLNFYSRKKVNEKNDELGKVNAELDRFVYSVSHDLRAPLSSISGLIQLSERATDLNENKQYLELMKGRIDKLEHFIRDIINFSRNARSELLYEDVNLRRLVDEIVEMLGFLEGASSLVTRNLIDEHISLHTDRTRLQMVLYNLISNAIIYRDPSKPESWIQFEALAYPDGCRLEVKDNGIGIAPAYQEKVFDMFYRASANSKGSGLGLYIVKEAVARLGGTIDLKSAIGEGTSFTLNLPSQPKLVP